MSSIKKVAGAAAAFVAIIAASVFFTVIKPANDKKVAEAKEAERQTALASCKAAEDSANHLTWTDWTKAIQSSASAYSGLYHVSDKTLSEEFLKDRDDSFIDNANTVTCAEDASTETLNASAEGWKELEKQIEEHTAALKDKTKQVEAIIHEENQKEKAEEVKKIDEWINNLGKQK